jgi:cytosine/adenosine deaminase-related metal-dependent hydrolase
MRDDGGCVVDNFTVGREGYGNVFFPDTFDVGDLNLDEIGEYGKLKFIIIFHQYHSSRLVCLLIVKAIAAGCLTHTHLLEQQQS